MPVLYVVSEEDFSLEETRKTSSRVVFFFGFLGCQKLNKERDGNEGEQTRTPNKHAYSSNTG